MKSISVVNQFAVLLVFCARFGLSLLFKMGNPCRFFLWLASENWYLLLIKKVTLMVRLPFFTYFVVFINELIDLFTAVPMS